MRYRDIERARFPKQRARLLFKTYTYFKKRCRRERRMAVVERKLHDRKELRFPYLVGKNDEFFA